MTNKISKILLLNLLVLSSSCALIQEFSNSKPVQPIDYIESGKKMDFQTFFNGEIEGFSIVQGENGSIIETQKVKMSGSWDENKGVVKKNYVSNDGKKDNRTWLITVNKDGTFDAVGHDVSAPAKGKQIGNAAQSVYSLMVDEKEGRGEVTYEDRMYLVEDDAVIMITNYKRKKSDSVKFANKNYGKIITSLKKITKKPANE